MKSELSFIEASIFGGIDNAERCVIRFGNKDELGYELDFPIDIIKISP